MLRLGVLCAVLCVGFCTGLSVMVLLNLTCLQCLQHSFFEDLLNSYDLIRVNNIKPTTKVDLDTCSLFWSMATLIYESTQCNAAFITPSVEVVFIHMIKDLLKQVNPKDVVGFIAR